ncbi:MAG: heme exporter protein CcmB [SAR324 cluster bacterium]|nr:heme exporter protein CcmB [SAR324 cluster bacterium]MBL7034923.1 heme exporter protein CcmB [SAR324 cluster bacterium]
MQLFFRQTIILVWKDVLIDLRRKDNLLSMLLFAILTLLIFQFAMGEEPELFLRALPGVIWIVFLLSGVLGLGKSFVQEVETGCMGGLLTAPVDRSVLFLGKMLANTLFILFTQLLFVPLCLFLFDVEVKNWLEFSLVLFFGTVGFSSLGTLLTAMTATVRGKDMLLPILIFPLMVPSLLCVVRLTDFLFFGFHAEEVWSWWKLLLGFDVVIFTLSLLAYEFVVEE